MWERSGSLWTFFALALTSHSCITILERYRIWRLYSRPRDKSDGTKNSVSVSVGAFMLALDFLRSRSHTHSYVLRLRAISVLQLDEVFQKGHCDRSGFTVANRIIVNLYDGYDPLCSAG